MKKKTEPEPKPEEKEEPKEEVLQIDDIPELILQGHTKTQIIHAIKTNLEILVNLPNKNPEIIFWEALDSLSTFKEMGKEARVTLSQEFALALYKEMKEIGDFTGALAALKELNKLTNVYEYSKEIKPEEERPKTINTNLKGNEKVRRLNIA